MRILLRVVALALALGGCSIDSDTTAAEAEVSTFHAMLDAGRFSELYAAGGEELKKAAPEPDFVALLAAVHRKLGAVKTATKQAWNVNVNTAGRFVTLTYATDYEGGQATEQFVYRMDGKAAKLAGYNINSMALILK